MPEDAVHQAAIGLLVEAWAEVASRLSTRNPFHSRGAIKNRDRQPLGIETSDATKRDPGMNNFLTPTFASQALAKLADDKRTVADDDTFLAHATSLDRWCHLHGWPKFSTQPFYKNGVTARLREALDLLTA